MSIALMHYIVKPLGLLALTVLTMPVAQALGFSKESWGVLPPALAQGENVEARESEADRLMKQGIQQYSLGRVPEALQSWQQALAIYRAINDRLWEGKALGNLGLAYFGLGQYERAIDFHEQSLAIARELGNRDGEGKALGNLGLAYQRLGNYRRAIEFYEQSLVIARELGDRPWEGTTLRDLGSVYDSLSQYERAIDFHEQSLAITRELGDRAGEGGALGRLGVAYDGLGEYERAISFHEQSLEIARELGDRVGERGSLGNLGITYHNLGQYERAIDFHEQSLVIAREIGDRAGESNTLGNLGVPYNSLGQYQRAIDLYEQRLVIAREIRDRAGEGTTLGNLGNVYHNLGQYERAIDFHERSLAIAREIGDRAGEGVNLGNLANVYNSLGQYERAINSYEQRLAIAREIGDRAGEGRALGNLGLAYFNLGRNTRAIDFYEQSLVITRELGIRAGEGATLGNLGNVYHILGQYQRTIDFLEQHLAIAHELGDRQGEAIVLNNQGAALITMGQFPQAVSALQQSIEIFESLRTDLPNIQLIAIADTQRSAYLNLVKALTAQGKTTEALVITERGRARAFLLQLANRLTSDPNQEAIAKAPTTAEIQQIARDTNSTLVTYSQIFDQALYIWVVQPSGEIAFRSVEFQGSSDAGLAINPITAIDGPVYRSAPDDSELSQLVADSRASIVVESTSTRPEQLRDLHTLLIDPIADLLPTNSEAKVVFVPQGNLFLVPFAALQNAEGTYLIEKHTILTAPSIQVYGLANEAASTIVGTNGGSPFSADNALIVGNPTMPKVWSPTASGDFAETQLTDLPGAKAEAEAIGGFLNITPLIGSQATEARVKQLLPSARLIHLATHGLLDYGDPRAYGRLDVPGAIALTPDGTEDGLLTSAEILEMDLQAELAVLSACDTGRGRITGDGVVGLSRSLITAGVPSVVVSLWAVPDAPTAELMTEFYRQLDQGQDKAQALRQAMLTTMEQHPNPRNWAAFTLIGAAE